MTYRITKNDLEVAVKRLNQATGNDPVAWHRDAEGTYRASIGTYVLSGAYGGWQLQRLVNEGGGVHVISQGGFLSKRELCNQIWAIIEFLYQCEEELKAEARQNAGADTPA